MHEDKEGVSGTFMSVCTHDEKGQLSKVNDFSLAKVVTTVKHSIGSRGENSDKQRLYDITTSAGGLRVNLIANASSGTGLSTR